MKFIRYTIVLLVFLAIGGCKDYLDVNTTPNNPTVVTPAVLLPSGLIGTAFANGNELNRFSSVLINYLTGAGNSPANYDVYQTTSADFGNQWLGELYEGSLTEYQRLIETSDKLGAKAYTGIAKIMKAYTFSLVTDVWGDVPYSEALQGAALLVPRIDSQEDIYKGNAGKNIQSLFALVKEGLADLDLPTTATPGAEDVVYGGVIANWKRAGNTLLLKFAIQIIDREPALATTEINAVLAANNFITTNAQGLNVKFGSAVGSQSPIYTYNYISSFITDLIASTRYVNRLTALNDPRLPLFITRPSGLTAYATADNGQRSGFPTPNTNYSRWSQVVVGANGAGPIRLLSNAHRCFLLAEAKLRLTGVTGGSTANAYYQEGIRASMTDAGVPTATIDAYMLTAPAILAGTPAVQLEQIITQKYIAMTGNGIEAWNDWRRTGYPTMPENTNAVGVDGTRPVRAVYVNAELQRNLNFTLINTNVKVWWDVN